MLECRSRIKMLQAIPLYCLIKESISDTYTSALSVKTKIARHSKGRKSSIL